jgi:hypothetical protein
VSRCLPLLLDKTPGVRRMAARALATLHAIDAPFVQSCLQHAPAQEVLAFERAMATPGLLEEASQARVASPAGAAPQPSVAPAAAGAAPAAAAPAAAQGSYAAGTYHGAGWPPGAPAGASAAVAGAVQYAAAAGAAQYAAPVGVAQYAAAAGAGPSTPAAPAVSAPPPPQPPQHQYAAALAAPYPGLLHSVPAAADGGAAAGSSGGAGGVAVNGLARSSVPPVGPKLHYDVSPWGPLGYTSTDRGRF